MDDENTEQKIFSNVYGGGDGAFNEQGTSVTSSCESWRQFIENLKKMQELKAQIKAQIKLAETLKKLSDNAGFYLFIDFLNWTNLLLNRSVSFVV